jgi:hypothetical protein
MIALQRDEDLRLVFQSAECRRMDDTLAVDQQRRKPVGQWVRMIARERIHGGILGSGS